MSSDSDGREASGGTTPSSTPSSTTSCRSTPDVVKAVLEELKKLGNENMTVNLTFNMSGSNNTINIVDSQQVTNITQNNLIPNRMWTQPLNVKEKLFLEAMVGCSNSILNTSLLISGTSTLRYHS